MKVVDVASHILKNFGPMTPMKLQKLVYYSQAWHMVWEEKVLFDDEFEAWANGPVCRSLYRSHRREYHLGQDYFDRYNPKELPVEEIESIDAVCEHYSQFTAQQLSDKTHQEAPWLIAREGYDLGQSCEEVITKASIHEYYSGLS